MRYRRFSYRRSLVLSTNAPAPLGETRHAQRITVQLARTWWRPAADVYETPTAVMVTVELAGIDPEEVDVQLYEDAVVLEGRRTLPAEEQGGVFHSAEILQGPFRFELALPAVTDPERVEVRYERGLLRMTFPKRGGR
jgi:HSP20 family molecular chaperone IbpA